MSNRASSTPFQAGPPSPSSPATGLQKGNHSLFVPSDQIPQSPTSPLMSVSTQNYASNFTTSQPSPHQAISQPTNLSSPPSSAPMSTQVSQQPTVGTANSFPTPASSVSGHFMASTSADDPDHMDKSFGAMEREATSAPIEKAASTHPMEYEHRRTDHHRDAGTISSPAKELGQQKTTVDAMDIDVGASRSLDDDTLGSLEGFTSAFHLCRRSHNATGPDLKLDLVSWYGLGPVAKSVARVDPTTGEKINRLRKSYEGKLKGLGLAGRNKPVKNDPNVSGGLRHLTMWPEEEWQNQKVFGKEIKVADIDSGLHKLQMNAMKMEPGPVPNNDYWEDVLGHEKPSKNVGAPDTGKRVAATPNAARSASQSNGTPVPAEPERIRPSRGRKRTYDDNSFVGYGEGYIDDDDDVAFYSNAEGTGKKKRKKV